MNYVELKENIARICENEFTEPEYALFAEQAEQRIYSTVQLANLRKNVTGSITAANQYLQAPEDFLSVYSLAVYPITVTTNTYTSGVSWTSSSLNAGLLIFFGASAELLAQISKIKSGDAVVVNGTAYVAAFPSGANAIVLTTPTTVFDPITTVALTTTEDGAYEYLLNKDVNFIRQAYPNPTTTGKPKHYAIFGPRSNDVNELSFILGPTPNVAYNAELHYYYYPESIVTAGNTWLSENFDSALLNGALVEAIRYMKGEPDMVKLYQEMYLQSIALLKNLGDAKQRGDAYRNGQVRLQVN